MSAVRAAVRFLVSVAVLAGLFGGVPAALLQWGDWPINGVPTGEQVSDAPNALLSDGAIVGVLTVALWAAWALLVLSLVAEVIAQARGVTTNGWTSRLPFRLGGPFERLAGFLVGSIVFSVASASTAGATPALPTPAVGELPQADPGAHGPTSGEEIVVALDFAAALDASRSGDGTAASTGTASAGAEGPNRSFDAAELGGETAPANAEPPVAETAGFDSQPTVTVGHGDTPWSLAEAHLGDGTRWREVWELNRAITQPDGGQWVDADAGLHPGWELVLPADATGADAVGPIALGPAQDTGEVEQAPTEVTVESGDSFWGLAKKGLASWGHEPTDAEIAAYWQVMMDENEGRLLPPEDPDLIYPGQALVLPAVPGQEGGPHAGAEPAPDPNADPGVEAPAEDEGSAPEQGDAGSEEGAGASGTESGDDSAAESTDESGSPDDSTTGSGDHAGGEDAPSESEVTDETVDGGDDAGSEDETSSDAGSEDEATEETAPPDDASESDEIEAGPPETDASEGESPDGEGEEDAALDEDPTPDGGVADGDSTDADGLIDDTYDESYLDELPPEDEADGEAAAPEAEAGDAEEESGTDAGDAEEDEADDSTEDEAAAPEAGDAEEEAPSIPGMPSPGPSVGEESAAGEMPEVPDSGEGEGEGSKEPARPSESTDEAAAGADVDTSETSSSYEVEEEDSGSSSLRPVGLIMGGLTVAGAVALLYRRRRAQLRRRQKGEYATPPDDNLQALEQQLLEGADQDGAVLLDAALRAAAAGSGSRGLPPLRWVETAPQSVTLVLESAAPAPPGFEAVDAFSWQTRATGRELASLGSAAAAPAPTLVPVGATSETTEALIELETGGVISIDGRPDDVLGLVRAMALAAATAPWSEQSRVLLVGIAGDLTDLPWVSQVDLDTAISEAEGHAARTEGALRSLQCTATSEARASGLRPEAWDPLVVISAQRPDHPEHAQRLAELGRLRASAVGFVTLSSSRMALPGRALVLQDDGTLRIDGVDEAVWPRYLDEEETDGLVALMEHAGRRDEEAYQPLPADPGVRRPVRQPSGPAGPGEAQSSASERWPVFAPDEDQELESPGTVATEAEDGPAEPDPEPETETSRFAPEIPSLPELPDLPELVEVEDLLQAGATAADEAARLAGNYDDDRYGSGAESELVDGGGRGPSRDVEATPPTGTVEVAPAGTAHPEALRPVGGVGELLAEVDVLVRVLGDVEAVRLNGEAEEKLVPTRQKGLEAITYLALRETSVGREDLEINLFPDGTQKAKTVYNTISSARALVGDDLFPAPDSSRYVLSDRVVTDYGLFCELVAQADETEDAHEAARLLTDGLSVVRGEPFLGVGRNYTWVGPHRGMIVAQVVDAAEELAEIRLATGDWRAAEWAARQGLKAFPADERMYRLLMRAASAAGNVAGVRRVFSELCDVTADPDLGVEPEDTLHPETVELLEELTRSTQSSPHQVHA